MRPEELRADPWAFGPWCWCIGAVRLLHQPVPHRGMNGLWPLSAEARAACWRELQIEVLSGLTIQQPYGSAVAAGLKRVENRSWRRHLAPGTWLGLHVGIAPVEDAEDFLDEWRENGQWPDAPALRELPRGVLLGAFRVDAITRYPDEGQAPLL
jgi:hypothetical protein